ncbi:putative GTP-binding protein 6 [Diadema antillarum]|uniref:putative GTP-binding protein 6 n=1 Tax=Diadema antillarum TaxID=105358 RepID=UPI003A8AB9BF
MEEFDEEVDSSDLAFDYANKLTERGHRTIAGHKVLIIQPVLKGLQTSSQHSSTLALQLAEAVSLVQTLPSWSVVDTQRARMRSATKRAMFGKGTLQDLTEKIHSDQEVSTVFLDVDRLSGLQKGFLEEAWGRPVLDRFELVLEIFKSHASSREAKLQIALAEVHFRKSHLRQAVEELDQQGGGQQYIGGGGETLLEKQQRLLRDKEGALRKALAKLKQKRGLLRAGREKKNFPHVAVVGYTNAGKTSLIKALTGSSKLDPQDRLFATLDVTSHVGQLTNRMRVIFLDTVGFIANLPHELIASFSATLEDVLHADLILLVTDVSHPDWPSQRLNVLNVLHDLGVAQNLLDNVVEVSNKVDLIPAGSGEELTEGSLPVSAREGTGVTFLKEVIEQRLLDVTDLVKCAVKIPQAGLHLGWLYKEATVEEVSPIEGDAEHLRVDAVFSKSAFAKFCAQFGDSRIT